MSSDHARGGDKTQDQFLSKICKHAILLGSTKNAVWTIPDIMKKKGALNEGIEDTAPWLAS